MSESSFLSRLAGFLPQRFLAVVVYTSQGLRLSLYSILPEFLSCIETISNKTVIALADTTEIFLKIYTGTLKATI